MTDYTDLLQSPLDTISWEDDNFMEELLRVAQLFRSFSTAMTEFISVHGYTGDADDINAKTAFVQKRFVDACMTPPREIREWFSGQPIKRETAFRICFAFGLDIDAANVFFQTVCMRERSFNCHLLQEAVYYVCMRNGMNFADAQYILNRVRKPNSDGETVYTGAIIADLNRLKGKTEIIDWLNGNIDKFVGSNVTAYAMIRRLWNLTAGSNGLLLRERHMFSSMTDDHAARRIDRPRANPFDMKPWDAYLAIFQLDKRDVKRLETDRTIRPILERLHEGAQDSFPDRQGIERILRGEHVSYERVRKWLVLLTFYTFWAKCAVNGHDYSAVPDDADRCVSVMNRFLIDAGYPQLYVGNPYDWIFFYAAKDTEPLITFRYIWNELLTVTLEARTFDS